MAYDRSSRRNTLVVLLVGAVALGAAMILLVSQRVRFDETPRIEEIGVISPEHSEVTHASVIAKGVPTAQPVGETPGAEVAPEEAPAPGSVAVAGVDDGIAPEVAEPADRPEVANAEDALISPVSREEQTGAAEQLAAAVERTKIAETPRAALNDPFAAVGTQTVKEPVPPVEEASGIKVAAASVADGVQETPADAPAEAQILGADSAEQTSPAVDPTTPEVAIDPKAPEIPQFDLVRLEADGSGIIAGRAAPGATVDIVAGGAKLAKVIANESGAFVAFLDADSARPSDNIELISSVDGGPLVRSSDSILVLERVVEAIKGPADPAATEEPAPVVDAAAQGVEGANEETAVESAVEPVTAEAAPNAAPAQDASEEMAVAALDAEKAEETAPQDTATTRAARPRSQISAPIIANTTEGIRIVQPSMIAPDQVSLDTISYDEAGEVVIAGRGQPGGQIRLYVDQAAAAEVPVGEGGNWTTTLTGIDEGRYILRADEISPDGRVSSRAESPFQREFLSPENIAQLTSEKEVIVQPGANLWNIAKLRYGDGIKYWVIFDANENQIRDPDLIFPGQILDLPDAE